MVVGDGVGSCMLPDRIICRILLLNTTSTSPLSLGKKVSLEVQCWSVLGPALGTGRAAISSSEC